MPTVGRGLFRWLFCSGARLEDFADRLNHVWTFGLLLILGAVISWKHGYQSPITCWCPPEFPAASVVYTHKRCWHSYYMYYPKEDEISDESYHLPIVEHEPKKDESEYITTYYQWVPVILCLQALLFKLPNIILYIFHNFSGVDFDKIAGLTSGYQNLNLTERQNLASQVARYIYRWCNMFPRGLPWRLLTVIWFLVKCLYCINVVIQMAYIDRFLKTTNEPYDNSTSYGDVIYDNIAKNNGSFWKVSPVFPRTVFCDFPIRMLQNIQRWRIQCDLNTNPFTERAYMFLWVWLLFVSIVTMLSFAVWLLLTILPLSRQRYIKRFMELADETGDGKLSKVNDQDASMVSGIIGEDGVMVLKLLGANSSELLVKDVICGIARITRTGPVTTSGQIMQQPPTAQPVSQPTAPPGIYPTVAPDKAVP